MMPKIMKSWNIKRKYKILWMWCQNERKAMQKKVYFLPANKKWVERGVYENQEMVRLLHRCKIMI